MKYKLNAVMSQEWKCINVFIFDGNLLLGLFNTAGTEATRMQNIKGLFCVEEYEAPRFMWAEWSSCQANVAKESPAYCNLFTV